MSHGPDSAAANGPRTPAPAMPHTQSSPRPGGSEGAHHHIRRGTCDAGPGGSGFGVGGARHVPGIGPLVFAVLCRQRRRTRTAPPRRMSHTARRASLWVRCVCVGGDIIERLDYRMCGGVPGRSGPSRRAPRPRRHPRYPPSGPVPVACAAAAHGGPVAKIVVASGGPDRPTPSPVGSPSPRWCSIGGSWVSPFGRGGGGGG